MSTYLNMNARARANRSYRLRNIARVRESAKQAQRRRFAENPELFRRKQRIYYALHKERKLYNTKIYQQRARVAALLAYGGACVCCGEDDLDFLTIDHKNNDGAQHRKEVGGGRIHGWLRKHNYPKEGFQVLCFNCNMGRAFHGGVCPHQSKCLQLLIGSVNVD